MWNLARLEKVLPHWLQQSQLQWVQWVYAFWQFVRGNPLGLLVLSFLPFYLRQKLKKKTVVVVGETKDIQMTYEKLEEYLVNCKVIDIEVDSSEERDLSLADHEIVASCYKVKYNGYYYITDDIAMRQIAKCSELFHGNVLFVERALAVSGSLAVGKMISQTEAYKKVMSKRYFISKGPNCVVATCIDYFDYSSKFWGILSTIPILLQASNYYKCSTLLSLLIILLDSFRGPVYRLYDRIFNRLTRFVKLNIFKTRTELYDLFSIFSSRWRYCNPEKKYAYVAQPGEKMRIKWNCKLRSLDDIEIVDLDRWQADPADDNVFMAIFPDNSDYRAESSVMQYW